MKAFQYLIVGGGMTGDAAAKAIRKEDRNADIGLISAEGKPPYKRPPLTKDLWKGGDVNKIWLNTEEKGVEVILDTPVVRLDLGTRQVEDEQGNLYGYDKLLLATGGSVRKLPFGAEHILYYRYASDYFTLNREAENKNHFTVLGGSFIGSEIAAGLKMHEKDVTILFPEQGICANIFPIELSEFINDYYREKGVNVLAGQLAKGIDREKDQWKLITDQEHILTDLVIAGIGIQPNTSLAVEAGLQVDNGIVVDEYLLTSDPNVYAAGDVATIYNKILGRNIRYEHEDNAIKMGEMAGKNMSGKAEHYDEYLPYFYSDLFDLGYEAVGVLDARLETYGDWQEKYKKGVIYYHDQGKVKGVLLWNVWGALSDARQVIRETHANPVDVGDLKGRIQ